MSFNEIMECIYFKNYKKNFFPLPFFLSASSKDIKEISKNTTIIIISHEDSIFKFCNEIYEIKDKNFKKLDKLI